MPNRKCMGCMEDFPDTEHVCPFCGYEVGTPAKELYHLAPESILHDRYIIGKVLGFGGFGVTYIGWDSVLEKKVAIKEYLPGEFATRIPGKTTVSVYDGERREQFEAGLKSFVEEAQRLAKFNSVDGIVSVYDSFIENDTAYIVMEYLDGVTLKEILKEKKVIPYEEAIGYCLPVLYALEEVHKAGIIHRDIAPDNIFITKDGRVKLLDFGASRYATTLHSKSLSVILKPGYAPEEQYRSRGNQGPWSDVYAMAATLYRAITGKIPEDAFERLTKDEVKSPKEIGIKLPEGIENAIMNALNVKAENRIQSAKEFAEALSGEITLERVVVKPEKEDVGQWPVWQKVLLGVAAFSVVAVVILFATGTAQKIINRNDLLSVIELSLDEAKTELAKEPYNYTEDHILILEHVYDDVIPKDLVYDQSPNAGTTINHEKYPDIYLKISDGPEQIFMPDISLTGIELNAAKQMLEELGFVVVITEVESNEIAPGYVVSQDLAPDSQHDKGAEVTLQVSKGNGGAQVATVVPNVVGKKFEEAKNILTAQQLYTAIIKEEYSDSVPKGCVISQDPTADSSATTNSTIVNLIVSKGSQEDVTVRVPNVTYRTLKNAQTTLKENQLTYSVSYQFSDTVAAGTVISQSISANTKVAPGTLIELVVSKGVENASEQQKEQATQVQEEQETATTRPTTPVVTLPPTTLDSRKKVPDVVGDTQSTAQSKLSDFTVQIERVYSSKTKSGRVAGQSIEAGTRLNEGASITIFVSAGNADSAWRIVQSWPGTSNKSVQYRYKYKRQTGYYKDNWVATGNGSNTYCNFYTMYDGSGHASVHTGSFYNSYNDKVNGYDNGSTKRVITSDYENGQYYYFHWCRGTYWGGPINRSVCIGNCSWCGDYGPFYTYHAYVGDGNYYGVIGSTYQKDNSGVCADSFWFYRIPVRYQSWTEYKNNKKYVYRGDWNYTGSYSSWSSTTSSKSSYSPSNSADGYDIEYRYRENLPIYN